MNYTSAFPVNLLKNQHIINSGEMEVLHELDDEQRGHYRATYEKLKNFLKK